VLESPPDITEGVAEKWSMSGKPVGDVPETVTTVVAVALPAAFEAVRRYVVVELGDTVVLPVVAKEPKPWSIVTVVAFEISQTSVAEPPEAMLGGDAVNELMTGTAPPGEGAPDTTTCTVTETVLPAALDAVSS